MDLRIFTEPQQGATYDTLLAVASTAEQLGFDAFFRSDHYIAFEGDGLPGPTDAWLTLAALARETTTIRLGTLVSPVTFRYPGPARHRGGAGRPHVGRPRRARPRRGLERRRAPRQRHPVPTTGERFEMLEDHLAIVTGMWKTPAGELFDYAGKRARASKARPDCRNRCRRRAQRRRADRDGRMGREANAAPGRAVRGRVQPAVLPRRQRGRSIRLVRAACERADRDPATLTLSAAVVACCGEDEAAFKRRAKAIGQDPDQLRANQFGGTTAEVATRAAQYAAAGAQTPVSAGARPPRPRALARLDGDTDVTEKTLHETQRLSFDGAVDADGHILEPPDLWETYLEPAVPRPGAAASCATRTASRSSRSAGSRSMMSRSGFPSTLGAMGDPDLAGDAARPRAHVPRARRRSAAWTPTSG